MRSSCAGRRARAPSRRARPRRPHPHRHRRQRPEERPSRRGGRRAGRRLRRANGDEFVDLFGPLRSSRRRDPHGQRSAPPTRRRAVCGGRAPTRGDLYERDYEGQYCIGCEAFLDPDELDRRSLPRAPSAPDVVGSGTGSSGLSRYGDRIGSCDREWRAAHRARRRVATRCSHNSFEAGCATSASRGSIERAHGGGSRCPTTRRRWSTSGSTRWRTTSPRSGTAPTARPIEWWHGSGRTDPSHRQGHHPLPRPLLAGDPAAAGLPLPTAVFVHDYLTVDGAGLQVERGVSRSFRPRVRYGVTYCAGGACATSCGRATSTFARSCWLGEPTSPRTQLGNLVARTVALVARSRPDGCTRERRPAPQPSSWPGSSRRLCDRRGARAIRPSDGSPRSVGDRDRGGPARASARAWELARHERETGSPSGDLDALLAVLVRACETAAHELRAFCLQVRAHRASSRVSRSGPARTLFPKAAHTRHVDGTLARSSSASRMCDRSHAHPARAAPRAAPGAPHRGGVANRRCRLEPGAGRSPAAGAVRARCRRRSGAPRRPRRRRGS